jgi:hypothetical protein
MNKKNDDRMVEDCSDVREMRKKKVESFFIDKPRMDEINRME